MGIFGPGGTVERRPAPRQIALRLTAGARAQARLQAVVRSGGFQGTIQEHAAGVRLGRRICSPAATLRATESHALRAQNRCLYDDQSSALLQKLITRSRPFAHRRRRDSARLCHTGAFAHQDTSSHRALYRRQFFPSQEFVQLRCAEPDRNPQPVGRVHLLPRSHWSEGQERLLLLRLKLAGNRAGEPVRAHGRIINITRRKFYEHGPQRTDRRGGRFLATLAHELRTLLAPTRRPLLRRRYQL